MSATGTWPPSSQLLDASLAQDYLNNLWNKKYGLGLYFSALHELGDEMRATAQIDGAWYHLPHAVCDGLSFVRLLDQKFDLGIQVQTEALHSPPQRWKDWARAIAAVFRSSRQSREVALRPVPAPSGQQEGAYCHLSFTHVEHPQRVLSLFLESVNRVLLRHLSQGGACRWMIPVSIQGSALTKHEQLAASYLFLSCSRETTAAQLHTSLVSKLKSGEHWGYYCLARAGLLLGRWAIMLGTKLNVRNKRTRSWGSFSFFGRLGGNKKHSLVLVHSVRPERPIGCSLYEYNGAFHLTLSLHEVLGITAVKIEELRHDLHQSLVSAGCR